ncbi:DUF2249 domain-containing protein [Gordonia sp. (in: high G+C Gram-positive bacteria)]|uniref:DUF2249 domain-containing protein n=1 Tax=Gordonia sp. (in: high G+C Gram-positive bacteria) TaxID=84139 RepID=UPI003C73B7E6
MTTNDVVMASNAADADTLEQQRQAIAEITGRVSALESALLRAASSGGLDEARTAVSAFDSQTLGPWLEAAQRRLLPGAAGVERARLLVEGLIGARMIGQLTQRVASANTDTVNLVADVSAMRALVEVFFGKIADILLPALAEDGAVSLKDLVAELPTAAPAAPAQPHGGGGGCACGEHDHDEPELDVRQIPHAIRHATVFGAFDAVPAGRSMILVAHHDPIPLLHQLADRNGGRIQVEYEERGPEAWRLRLTRV